MIKDFVISENWNYAVYETSPNHYSVRSSYFVRRDEEGNIKRESWEFLWRFVVSISLKEVKECLDIVSETPKTKIVETLKETISKKFNIGFNDNSLEDGLLLDLDLEDETEDHFNEIERLSEINSKGKSIFMNWKWGDIVYFMEEEVMKKNYGKNTWDVWIKEELLEVHSPHLFEEPKYEHSWKFYLVCENDRWTQLYKKQIPENILPLFSHLIDRANIDWRHRSYSIIKKLYN